MQKNYFAFISKKQLLSNFPMRAYNNGMSFFESLQAARRVDIFRNKFTY
jgi:hypothetical protein